MTARETLDIISDSSLWEALSIGEKIEAISYAINIVGGKFDDKEISDLIEKA